MNCSIKTFNNIIFLKSEKKIEIDKLSDFL